MDFGYLLENPRRRRRRKKARRRRRPVAVAVATNPRRRRRRRRRSAYVSVATNPRRKRRRNPRRRSRRRNPFGGGRGMFGGIMPTLNSAMALTASEFVGDALARAAVKFTPLGKMTLGAPFVRIGIGLFAPPLLKMLRLPGWIRKDFGAINVASGLISMTNAMRGRILAQVGLADYEFADYEFADYELADAPPRGILGTPPAGVFGENGYDDEEMDLLGEHDYGADYY